MFSAGVDDYSLSEEVLAHLDHEPAALRPSTVAVSDERLVAAIQDAQWILLQPHLVIQGQYGPVTILLMPEEPVASAVSLDGENVHGAILPVGDGSIAIIGVREEPLEQIEESVLKSVMWST